MKLSLSRSDDAPGDWPTEDAVRTLDKICGSLEPFDASINVIVVDDAYIQGLNARFRGKDRPTDVISFSYIDDLELESEVDKGRDDLVGEIYISRDTVVRDATQAGLDASHLFLRMGVHGMLHVLGYEHDDDADATLMEQKERDLLAAHIGQDSAKGLF